MHKKAVNLGKEIKWERYRIFKPLYESRILDGGFAKCVIKTDSLRIKFNTVYYIAKHEKAFTYYPNLLELQEKNNVQGNRKNYITDCAAGVHLLTS